MDRYFRYKLTAVLVSFTLILSLIIVVADYMKLKRSVNDGLELQIENAESEIIESISTIDKVYRVMDIENAKNMEKHSKEMLRLYEQNPDISTWDYDALKQQFGMDVFILNRENIVVESSYLPDVGLNFTECCPKFSELLTERREAGVFSHDPLDIHQKTRAFKKFSYTPTSDGNYLIELAFHLEGEALYKEFNFIDTIQRLEQENEQIKSVKVYNALGLVLGETERSETGKIDPARADVFNEAFRRFEMTKTTADDNGQMLTYRYIPYKADDDSGISTNRIVEIAYYDVPFAGVLQSYEKQFIFELIAIACITIILSVILARLIARPIHLAFHDVLTGLKNRAAFEDAAVRWMHQKKEPLHFMIIDLDNFKQVNDTLGHHEGDKLLIQAAAIIKRACGSENLAARIGGDEFVVLCAGKTEQQVMERAEQMLETMRDSFEYLRNENISLSVSIGIAVSDRKDTIHTLYNKADLALYSSKKQGKDQYTMYDALGA